MYFSFRFNGSRLIQCRADGHLQPCAASSFSSFYGHHLSKSCDLQRLIRRISSEVVRTISAANSVGADEERPQNWSRSLNKFDATAILKDDGKPREKNDISSKRKTAVSYDSLWDAHGNLKQMQTARGLFEQHWKASQSSQKPDLSNWNVLKGEMDDKLPGNIIKQAHAFRAASHHSPHRSLTLLFMLEYYDKITSSTGLSDSDALSLLAATHLQNQSAQYDKIGCLLDYSWILLADPTHIVARFIALSMFRDEQNRQPLPLWLLLQILRTDSLSRDSVHRLTRWISPRLEYWNWSGNSPMILGVRLLRHARRGLSADFEAVTACFISAMKLRFHDESVIDIPVLCHWCNRFLSLLALPASIHPFRTVPSQQAAQLDLLQFMQDRELEISINREGYRALARVQLMHKKTASEREWAEAKALTWPPWEERDRMGAFPAPRRYDGQETRVMKVLNRMSESGYAPHKYEAALKILTGWDTDKSPTIQTARVAPRVPRPWEAGPDLQDLANDALIWSSRIEATRTKREAWAIFCAYTSRVPIEKQSQYVYLAMHKKLCSSPAPMTVGAQSLPGDGLEVFPDPELARDRVYVPQAVPTSQELVSKLLDNNIKCSDRVLAYLLSCETDIDTGLELMQQRRAGSDAQNVLSKPHNSSVHNVAKAMDDLRTSLRVAYVKLLTRPNTPKSRQFLRTYKTSGCSDGPSFMKQCLLKCESANTTVWNAYLDGIALHFDKSEATRYRMYSHKVAELMSDTLEHILQNERVNFQTLLIASPVAIILNLDINLIKEIFIAATQGSSTHVRPNWLKFCAEKTPNFYALPTGDNIELMAWALGSTESPETTDDILALLHWVHHRKEHFSEASIKITSHNLAVFRLLLEQKWRHLGFEGIARTYHLPNAQEGELRNLLTDFPMYPDDYYMDTYLTFTESRRSGIQLKMKKLAQATERACLSTKNLFEAHAVARR